MTVFIYDLIDPQTLKIRYVGKTINPRERLLNQYNEKSNTYRCHWIQSLRRKGLCPLQLFLEVLDDNDNWQSREIYWIKHFRDLGYDLVNCTDGGDGVTNISGESKERMIKTWVGRKHKPETLLKLSLASKGRKHDDKWRQYMSNKLKGRIFTTEDRIKLSKGISKLGEQQIKEIKELLNKHVSQYKIADMYHVHQGTISNIKLNKYYKWLKV
jgi:hypothetical protein